MSTPDTQLSAFVAKIDAHERALKQVLRSANPEELTILATHRIRASLADPEQMQHGPPHVMVQLIEACCAYWEQWRSKPLTEEQVYRAVQELLTFDDPVMLDAARKQDYLLDLGMYISRKQLEAQRQSWWVPIGRASALFLGNSKLTTATTEFYERYNIGLDTWIKCTYIIQCALSRSRLLRSDYFSHFHTVGIADNDTRHFLAIASRTPFEIGEAYRNRLIQCASDPVKWLHARPQLATTPMVHLSRGYVVPVEAYFMNLYGEVLFTMLTRSCSEKARAEVATGFAQYVENVLTRCIPHLGVWSEKQLMIVDGKVCDIAIELEKCILLFECKAIVSDRELATARAVLGSNVCVRVSEGFVQLECTARRIRQGLYAQQGISADKPVYGFVVTLGEIPQINHSIVNDECIKRCTESGEGWDASVGLKSKPQVLHGFAIEYFAIYLQKNPGAIEVLQSQRDDASPFAIGDWEKLLAARCQDELPMDLDLWRNWALRLPESMGIPSEGFG